MSGVRFTHREGNFPVLEQGRKIMALCGVAVDSRCVLLMLPPRCWCWSLGHRHRWVVTGQPVRRFVTGSIFRFSFSEWTLSRGGWSGSTWSTGFFRCASDTSCLRPILKRESWDPLKRRQMIPTIEPVQVLPWFIPHSGTMGQESEFRGKIIS